MLCCALATSAAAQDLVPPAVTLVPAPALSLTGGVDSNSPAVWDSMDGVETLQVDDVDRRSAQPGYGRRLSAWGRRHRWPSSPIQVMASGCESVIVDEGGTWYGYYHNEVPAAFCGRLDRVMPRIGAARSRDNGATWEDLGIILEAPPGWHDAPPPTSTSSAASAT